MCREEMYYVHSTGDEAQSLHRDQGALLFKTCGPRVAGSASHASSPEFWFIMGDFSACNSPVGLKHPFQVLLLPPTAAIRMSFRCLLHVGSKIRRSFHSSHTVPCEWKQIITEIHLLRQFLEAKLFTNREFTTLSVKVRPPKRVPSGYFFGCFFHVELYDFLFPYLHRSTG